jgi:Zn ribbon nucleic-acid-binding protein
VYVRTDTDATIQNHLLVRQATVVSPSSDRDFTAQKHSRTLLTRTAKTGKIHTNHTPCPMTATCKHPIVKVVAREDDIEFVECQQCGEVFDSAEYSDIAIEEEESVSDPLIED